MDRQLVVRAREGDHSAFAALAAASIGGLTAVARLTLRDGHHVEDAVQEALIEAWRGIRGLRDPDRFEAWLHRLLMRACFDQVRRERHHQGVELSLLPSSGSTAAAADRHLLLHDELERGRRTLRVEQRAVGFDVRVRAETDPAPPRRVTREYAGRTPVLSTIRLRVPLSRVA